MSAAFRNFIITFVVMFALFGFLAYKALPDINAALFPSPQNTSGPEESSGADISVPEDTSAETSDPDPVVKDNVFDCIIAAKNDSGAVCSLIYVSVSELNKTYTVCRIPVDLHVKDNSIYRVLSTQLGSNNEEYLLKKLSPLVGKEIKHYIICNTASFEAIISAAEKAKKTITVNLPYQVRYLRPEYAEFDEKYEEYYTTISGSVELTPENIAAIFNSYADDQSVGDYYFQDATLGMNVFVGLVSLTGLGTDTNALGKLHAAVRTDIPLSDVLKYSRMLFSYSEYNVKQLTYPSAYYSSNKVTVKVPNWEKGIKDLASAEEK